MLWNNHQWISYQGFNKKVFYLNFNEFAIFSSYTQIKYIINKLSK